MIKIIVNNDSESSDPSLLARHITEDTIGMIKAWLAGVGEAVEDIKVKAVPKGLGYIYVTAQVVMKLVYFYIAAENSLDRPFLLRG
ncbi:hypothetical protein NW767_009312 [Fusarium falciforme]|nr:hypothetical protein NW767_009312 [Fusarium falciforme]